MTFLGCTYGGSLITSGVAYVDEVSFNQVEAASVSVANMRRDLQARERRAAELEAAVAALRDKSSTTDAQLTASRQRVRELEVCPFSPYFSDVFLLGFQVGLINYISRNLLIKIHIVPTKAQLAVSLQCVRALEVC